VTYRHYRYAALGLAGIGIAISAYLTITHAAGHEPSCLGGSHACATVAASRYSEIGPFRVAELGIVGYLALAVIALLRGDMARTIGAALAITALVFSGWLTWLELTRIHAICQWCAASAVVTVLLAIVHVGWLLRTAPPEDAVTKLGKDLL